MFLFLLVLIGFIEITCIENPQDPPWNWELSPDDCLG